jgi:DNA polymerase III epsilon subunit-like protein
MSENNAEIYISVDVETSGPSPSEYSLLTIGACTVFEPQSSFYVELQPVNDNKVPEAMLVNRLSFSKLKESGTPPEEAMTRFEAWLQEVTPDGSRPLFVALNAPFDWMFVSDYFHRYLGRNPFGYVALDIKAFYMGLTGVSWEETAKEEIFERYFGERHLTHHALRDALDQAELFRELLAETRRAP